MHSCAEVKQNVEKVCECTGEEKKAVLCSARKTSNFSTVHYNLM